MWARSRWSLTATFSITAVATAVLLALAGPVEDSAGLMVVGLAASLAAGAAAAVVLDRWMAARTVDLRHHDLAVEVGSAVSRSGQGTSRSSVLRSVHLAADDQQHRLFGLCECSHCAGGQPSTGDLEATAPRVGLSGRSARPRQVIDLRSGVERPRRDHLGRRSAPTG